MNAVPEPQQVDRFRELVERRLGLRFDDARAGLLAETLQQRLRSTREPCDTYLRRLQAPPPPGEVRALAPSLTVAESYFFRDASQFRALASDVVPDRMAARAAGGTLRVLSAGCASGEEPFSLAMLLSERVTDPAWSFSIRAVDLNPAVLERAAGGLYSAWALRETPEHAKKRWFSASGRQFRIDDALRRHVTFEERNLAASEPDLWLPESYDVVFCRNVLMYFAPESALALLSRIEVALAPGGYLFLGHAETLRGLSHAFRLRHSHGAFYYQRPAAVPPRPRAVGAPHAGAPRGAGGPAALPEADTAWVERIRRASERIQALVTAAPPAPATRAEERGDGGPAPATSLAAAVKMLREERFGEALALVPGSAPGTEADPEALLFRATLLTHSGRLQEAQRECAALLDADDLNAGAHYLLALCHEGLGDAPLAREHDEMAAHLDPGFAMPRLHLGLLARRAGERGAARRRLAEALDLLRSEEPSRLLLFGGGFGRDALVALCRAELQACGGEA